ncbi:hypothetical protein FA15DRAFT_644541 [Coprinopsis marcescibilis]|uniref:Uncharacterized protein n=1 Tax=Coprinopsis marcescibilis TaxID=230819 RepID=A0A5C3KQX4_COPMA|nr:hypothetical protein FA15DRAFT_644541 [Coprinopsis marcescibilis]
MSVPARPQLSSLLESLKIPVEFLRYDEIELEQRQRLERWKIAAIENLQQLKRIVKGNAVDSGESLRVVDRADIILATAPFAWSLESLDLQAKGCVFEEERKVLHRECSWILTESQTIAHDIIAILNTQDQLVLKQILSDAIKPAFLSSNPHPSINSQTGKSLQPSQILRPPQQGGFSSVTQDFYESEGQRWKTWVGLGAILYCCVSNLQESTYEGVWHLVIPPLMTYLDDYQAPYKLWGLIIADAMLKRVPPSLLWKTGIDGLLRSSFNKALAHQELPHGPPVLRLAIKQSITLIVLTTQEGSHERFDQLCTLLGEGIITGIWTYAFDKPEIVQATLCALPDLVRVLDVGCVRFLRMLIPQIVQPLVLPSATPLIPGIPSIDPPQLQLQISSLKVLIPLIDVCAPRISGWRLNILDGLVRCWVSMLVDRSNGFVLNSTKTPREPDSDDEDQDDGDSVPSTQNTGGSLDGDTRNDLLELKGLLQTSCLKLSDACPSMKAEYERLLETDPRAFAEFFELVK